MALRRRSSRGLSALGGSYFSSSVAARGWPSPYESLIGSVSQARGVDSNLIRAIISAESAWRPDACSTSSCGLMQINYGAHGLTRDQVLDPSFNVDYGAQVIGEQLRRRPSIQLALAAYNAGTGRTDADLQDRISRDVNRVGTYVQTVLDYLTWFQAQSYTSASAQPLPEPEPFGEDVYPQEPSAVEEGIRQVLSAMEPWQWAALGGAAGLVVLLVVMRR